MSQVDRFEIDGESLPSTEMGGDLIDAVESDGNLLADVFLMLTDGISEVPNANDESLLPWTIGNIIKHIPQTNDCSALARRAA